MRISVLPEDSGYPNTWKHNPYTCKVLLNGEEIERCVTADEEAGTVECLVSPATARQLPLNTSPWPTYVRRGKVELVWDG